MKLKTATKLGMRARVGIKTEFMTTLSDIWVMKDCFCIILFFYSALFYSVIFYFIIYYFISVLFLPHLHCLPTAGLLLCYSQHSADSRDKRHKVKVIQTGNYKNIFFVSRGGQPSPEGHSDNVPGCTCGAGGCCSRGQAV